MDSQRPTRPDGGRSEPPPGLRDASLVLLLLTVASLQGYSWWTLEGYQLADSVEYMERAQSFARRQPMIDAEAIRSFGFSALLVPLFSVADWIGLQDFKPIVWLVRCFQMALGLVLVCSCVRLGTRLAGRRAGLAAGFVAGANPIFLQYSVSPVSGIAAAVCVAHALEAALDRGDFRRGARAGAWMGAALIMAYQTVIITIPLAGLLFLRDRRRGRKLLGGIVVGGFAVVLLQVALDKIVYGFWGASLREYFLENFGSLGGLMLAKLGFVELGRMLYEAADEAHHVVQIQDGSTLMGDIRSLTSKDWYLRNLTQMLAWPIIGLALLGVVFSLNKPRWPFVILVALLVFNVGLMSIKGAKDFRLWLPLLPMIAPLCGLGWAVVRGSGATGLQRWRPIVAGLLLLVGLVFGVQQLLARNTLKFSGYWRAIDIICEAERGRVGRGEEKARVSSAYHWAVYLRETGDVDLTKLPHHLDHWDKYSEEQHWADARTIESMDWFITHLPVLSNHKDLMQWVNARFDVHAMLWDRTTSEDIGPVFVLKRRRQAPAGRTFYEVVEGVDPEDWRRQNLLPPPMRFMRRLGEHVEDITLLGWEFEELPGDGHGWITYHWYTPGELRGDYTIVDRLTTFDERNSWQNNHGPAYGVLPTSTWQPGWIVRESWPVVAAANPFQWQLPYRPMGAAYRRGDLMPAHLWIDLATFGEGGQVTGRLVPARPDEDEPVRRGELAATLETPDGYRFATDDLVRVGSFFLPVHAHARLADDGRPIVD